MMRHVTTSILTATAIGMAAAVTPSLAAATDGSRTLAAESRPTSVTAWQGDVLWSSYRASDSRFHLVHSHAGAAPVDLPVAPSTRAFDVDLGTNAAGHPYAVYTRCSDGAGDCDVYRLALATGREEHLTSISSPTADERDPTIYDGRIAFVRHEKVGGKLQDTVRIGSTIGGGGGSRVLVRGGSLRAPELGTGELAYVEVLREGRYGFGERRVHVRRTGSGSDRVVYSARSGGANYAEVTEPSLSDTGRSFIWARTNQGSGTGNRIVQWQLGARRLAYAQGSGRWGSTAWAGGDLGLISAGTFGGDCYTDSAESPDESFCRIDATGPVRFTGGR